MIVRHGEIWFADLTGAVGSEQSGVRPVLVLQNDVGCKFSPTVLCAPFTSRTKKYLPTHVTFYPYETGLNKESTVLTEQIRTLDKTRLISKIGILSIANIQKVIRALQINIGIEEHILKAA